MAGRGLGAGTAGEGRVGDEGCVIVCTTLPPEANSEELGRLLVTERLAACVSVLAPVRSVYRWEGEVEVAAEQLLHIKTTARQVRRLRERVRELHPYDLPEFVVLPIVDGDPAYLAWLTESTAGA